MLHEGHAWSSYNSTIITIIVLCPSALCAPMTVALHSREPRSANQVTSTLILQ